MTDNALSVVVGDRPPAIEVNERESPRQLDQAPGRLRGRKTRRACGLCNSNSKETVNRVRQLGASKTYRSSPGARFVICPSLPPCREPHP